MQTGLKASFSMTTVRWSLISITSSVFAKAGSTHIIPSPPPFLSPTYTHTHTHSHTVYTHTHTHTHTHTAPCSVRSVGPKRGVDIHCYKAVRTHTHTHGVDLHCCKAVRTHSHT